MNEDESAIMLPRWESFLLFTTGPTMEDYSEDVNFDLNKAISGRPEITCHFAEAVYSARCRNRGTAASNWRLRVAGTETIA
jgi:phage tail sheath gpL-like